MLQHSSIPFLVRRGKEFSCSATERLRLLLEAFNSCLPLFQHLFALIIW